MARSVNISVSFIILILFATGASSQNLIVPEQDTEQDRFVARIKQFNEFVDRFNYEADFNDEIPDSAFMALYPRERYMTHLFNRDLLTGPNNKASLISSFIADVCNNNRYLYKYSPSIIAAAKTRIIYEGREDYITIFLNQEIVGNDMVKWVILDVEGGVLDFMQTDTSYIRFISPSSNETNFINLRRALADSLHLQDYAYANYDYDQLSVFFYCIYKGIIKVRQVEKITYHISDIPGWCFSVEEFNRSGYNSGWLISDIYECDLEFSEFLEYIKME